MSTIWTKVNNNTTPWTGVPKPAATTSVMSFQFVGGTPLGLLLAITTSSVIGVTSTVTSNWTSVAGHATPWTSVPKAT